MPGAPGTDGMPGAADAAPGTEGIVGAPAIAGAPGIEGIEGAPAIAGAPGIDGAPAGEATGAGDAIMEEPMFCIIWPAPFWPACLAAPSAAEPIPPAGACAYAQRGMHAKISAVSPAKICTFIRTPPGQGISTREEGSAVIGSATDPFHIVNSASNPCGRSDQLVVPSVRADPMPTISSRPWHDPNAPY